jgi:hypothetical protein
MNATDTSEEVVETDSSGRILLAIMWPGLVLLIVIMLGSVALVLGVAYAAGKGATDLGRLLSEAHAITRLVSLLIIVPTIWTLTMQDKVAGSAAIAALSAIAGYVLGGTSAGSP